MVRDYSSAEFGNIIIEVNQIFRLLVRLDIVEVNVLVSPFKVMNDSLVSELLLHNENVLKKINNPFLDIKVVELRNHDFLAFQVLLVCIDQSIPLIYYTPNIVKHTSISTSFK